VNERQAPTQVAELTSLARKLARSDPEQTRSKLVASPLLSALRASGTQHVYADTADAEELAELLDAGNSCILAEIDGNTANQPLVRKVLERILDAGDPRGWAREIRALHPIGEEPLVAWVYALVCGRIGREIARRFGAGRPWEVSLQLPMTGTGSEGPGTARGLAEFLRAMAPTGLVKVPFTPHEPECLLLARDLERAGIPVNFTSTFSARQVVTAALLANVSRTNVFLGRLNQGLEAALLGEHVALEAQRALTRLRDRSRTKTRLIVASMREWETFVRTAGCDVFTAPPGAIHGFLAETERVLDTLESRLETSYEDRLGISASRLDSVGIDRIGRLFRVEPAYVEFLSELRDTHEFAAMADGESLRRWFETAGFGDFFHEPDSTEWQAVARDKIPDFDDPVSRRLPLDTLYTLHAHADFVKHQEAMNATIAARLES
jgi:transaldolase